MPPSTDIPLDAASFRAWRAEMGWTQERAGAELGLGRRTIIDYENGKHPVSRVVGLACVALALAYGAPST